MSEFQLYDFRRIDKALTSEEVKMVKGLSSHIDVSSRRAVVSYSYGDFKHNEEKVVEQFFDALLYQTNWGQKKLVFRFPQDSIDYQKLGEYDIDMGNITGYTTEIRVWKSSGYVLLNIEYCDDNYEDWVEENDNSLDAMLGLRAEMMNGDFSCLFAFWLKLLSMREEDEEEDDDEEDDEDDSYQLPSLPYGLAKPSTSLQEFMNFYEIDERAVKAAGSFLTPSKSIEPDFVSAIENMKETDKNDWLMRVIEGELLLDIKLKKELSSSDTSSSEIKVDFETIMSRL
jgi:hypothetical protein